MIALHPNDRIDVTSLMVDEDCCAAHERALRGRRDRAWSRGRWTCGGCGKTWQRVVDGEGRKGWEEVL